MRERATPQIVASLSFSKSSETNCEVQKLTTNHLSIRPSKIRERATRNHPTRNHPTTQIDIIMIDMHRMKYARRAKSEMSETSTLDEVDIGVQKLQTLARRAVDTYTYEKEQYFDEPTDPRRTTHLQLLVLAILISFGWDSWLISIFNCVAILKIYFDVTRFAVAKAWGLLFISKQK